MRTYTKTQFLCSFVLSFFLAGAAFSQAPTIKELGKLSLGGSSTDVWSWVDPNTDKEYCVVGVGGAHIVDVTEPSRPQKVSEISGVPVFDEKVYISPDNKVYIYFVNGSGNSTGHIVDATDPNNPKKVSTFTGSHNVTIMQEEGIMITSIPGIKIYDIKTNPERPQTLWDGTRTGEGHDVTTMGNMLYDFSGRTSTMVYNISDPRNPRKLGDYRGNVSYHHHGMPSKEGTHVYICDELAGTSKVDITVIDISDPTDIRKVDDYADGNTVHNLYVLGDYAYTSYYQGGFKIFDVSNPAKIELVAEEDCARGSGSGMGGAFGIAPYGRNGKMFINSDGTLFIYDVTDFTVGAKDKDKLENIALEIYPNPNSGNFFVDIKGEVKNLDNPLLKVTNLEGKLVYQENLSTSTLGKRQIDLNDLPKGMYFVQLQSAEKMINKKVVIR